MGAENARELWFERLRALRSSARLRRKRDGGPDSSGAAMAQAGLSAKPSTVGDWFGNTVTREFRTVWPLIEVYLSWGGRCEWATEREWEAAHTAASQAGADQKPTRGDRWARLVRTHGVWDGVEGDADPFREQTEEAARRLAAACDAAEARCSDPWQDADSAERFTDRTGTLLNWMRQEATEGTAFSPVEAMVVALAPLLHHTYAVRTAADLVDRVGPLELDEATTGDEEARQFRFFLRDHPWLVRRAKETGLPDRKEAGPEISWWLFHRWLVQERQVERSSVQALLECAGQAGTEFRQVLDATRVTALLRALRLEPARLANAEELELGRRVHVPLDNVHGVQYVRDRLLAQLLSVARAMTIELTGLPGVVAEHVGIPEAVDLGRLRSTVGGAVWSLTGGPGSGTGCALVVECADPATFEAMRAQVTAVDVLLRELHRSVDPREDGGALLRRLPSYASASGVRAAVNADGRPAFNRTARFQVDERRVQELLMGNQLYRDPQMAIRELYQNALDACRYRRAREQYEARVARRSADYRGSIRFVQGLDENRRAYVECRDNGIGMAERELLGVFSRAGVGFAGTAEFAEERAEWAREGVSMSPNSRFGIGVLSYFMLADEIRVSTRRMAKAHHPAHESLVVKIVGPGHLFQIRTAPEPQDEPGTTVRLYLRRESDLDSCVEVLRRLLGIAEFPTTAELTGPEQEHSESWARHQLVPRQRRAYEQENSGLDAYGELSVGPLLAEGQVVWCESGGGVLVDGLLTRTTVRRGVLACPTDRGELTGAVVNLTDGQPVRLSVDRKEILEDVSARVERLLTESAPAFVASGGPLPDFRWIERLTRANPRLADIVAGAAAAAGLTMRIGERDVDLSSAGCLPLDVYLTGEDREGSRPAHDRTAGPYAFDNHGAPADHVMLWRVLALGLEAELELLRAELPEISGSGPVEAAVPSDAVLLATPWDRYTVGLSWGNWRDFADIRPGWILATAGQIGVTPHRLARRVVVLGAEQVDPARFPDSDGPNEIDLALVSDDLDGKDWLKTGEPVPLGHLLEAHVRYGRGLTESAATLRGYGFTVMLGDAAPERPTTKDRTVLSARLDGRAPWLSSTAAVPPGHVLEAARRTDWTTDRVCQVLAGYGLDVSGCRFPQDVRLDDDLVLLSANLDGRSPWLAPGEPVPAGHVVAGAQALDRLPAGVAARLGDYGLLLRDPLPAEVRPGDRDLLGWDPEGSHDWLEPHRPMSSSRILQLTDRLGVPARDLAARLVECGFSPPAVIPDRVLDTDRDLLRAAEVDEDGDFSWWYFLFTARSSGVSARSAVDRARAYALPIPRPEVFTELDERLLTGHLDIWSTQEVEDRRSVHPASVLLESARLGVPAAELAERLACFGRKVPHPQHIGSVTARVDLILLSLGLDGQSPFLPINRPVSLGHLLGAARKLGMSLSEVAGRLRELGLDSPEPAVTIRAALARVPRPASAPGPPAEPLPPG